MRTDVLIVGGGLAGLAAARSLSTAGVDFLLAEARPRLGGRILSIGPHGLDAGPAWFWPGHERVARLAWKLGVKTFRQHSEGGTVFEDGGGAVQRDLPFALNGEAFRIQGGAGRLIDRLAAGVPDDRLLLDHTAQIIERLPNRVRVTLKGPKNSPGVTARAVVLALPPRLVWRYIGFAPATTPEQIEALFTVPTWMAGHAKILALYDRPFWRSAGLSGDAISHRGPLAQIHDASPADAAAGALFGFVGLDAAARAQLGEAELKTRAGAQLGRLFGPEAAAPKDLIVMDWAQEKFTATASDLTAPSAHPHYRPPPALAPLERDGLIFASTEVAPEHGGFLDGALAAAERAVALAIERLKATAPA